LLLLLLTAYNLYSEYRANSNLFYWYGFRFYQSLVWCCC